jgi:hypothetical protein
MEGFPRRRDYALPQRVLIAGTASYNAANKNEKAVTPNGSDDCEKCHERKLPEGAAGTVETTRVGLPRPTFLISQL